MTSAPTGRVIVYRPRTWAARVRTFTVWIDGEEAGSLRGSHRVELDLPTGERTLSVHFRHRSSRELTVVVYPQQTTIVVVDIAPPTASGIRTDRDWLTARVTDTFNDKGVTLAQLRNQIGNPRSPRERLLYWLAFIVLIAGQVLTRTLNQGAGLIVGGIGAVTLIVLFFRRFLFRNDS